MKYFTLSQFVTALDAAALEMPRRIMASLTLAAKFIQEEAKSYIGTPQSDWKELKQSTIDLKNRLGYGGKGILDRTGEMRDSITYKVFPYQAIVESFNRALFYHETGTTYMPKRPVLTRAVFKNEKVLIGLLGKSVYPLITKYHLR